MYFFWHRKHIFHYDHLPWRKKMNTIVSSWIMSVHCWHVARLKICCKSQKVVATHCHNPGSIFPSFVLSSPYKNIVNAFGCFSGFFLPRKMKNQIPCFSSAVAQLTVDHCFQSYIWWLWTVAREKNCWSKLNTTFVQHWKVRFKGDLPQIYLL